jgi:activator of HSP90 ATPase
MRGFAFGLGSVACEPFLCGQTDASRMSDAPVGGDHRTALHQEIDLKTSAAEVEATLLDSKRFSVFTRLAATIDPEEGGAFSLFGGLIVGRNVEIVPATRIVQAWRPGHWEPGVYSVVRFALKPHDSGTTVVLDHTGFPEGDYEHLFAGWQAHYWDPLKTLFG